MNFFKSLNRFLLFFLMIGSTFIGGASSFGKTEVFKKHSILVSYEDSPRPIGPPADLDQKIDSAPTESDLEGALSDPSSPLYSLAHLYLELNQTLGPSPVPLCVDVQVKNGSAHFVISLPTDEAFEIGDAQWTQSGLKNWKKLKNSLILTSQNLRRLYQSDAPVDWTIDGYADALPYLDSAERATFYDIRKQFKLSFGEMISDLEKQKELARLRAESYRLPILNPEEDLQDLIHIQEIRGHATDQLELNPALWTAENRALPAHKTFFNEPSLLACKTRRKIKFSTTGTLGFFPILKRVQLFETRSAPGARSLQVSDLSVTPHFMDQATVSAIKTEVTREIQKSIVLLYPESASAPIAQFPQGTADARDLSERVLKNLIDRGVFVDCTPKDYLCTLALKFIQSRIEGKADEPSIGDRLISLIHSGLASLPSLALDIPKEIDPKTVESVGDLIALYRVPEEHWLNWGEIRIRGETLLTQNPDALTTEAVRLVLPDGNYRCARCGSGSILNGGNLTPNSRIVDRPDVFKESIARATRIDSNTLGSTLSPTAYFVSHCNQDCSICGGIPIDHLISQSAQGSGERKDSRVYVLNPAITIGTRSDLISIQEFRSGCLVTRKVLESCNVEPAESHQALDQTWSSHQEEVEETSSSSYFLTADSKSDPQDVYALRSALKRLKCSSSPETSIPTWDQYGDCHLDAWRPESGPGSWEWFRKKF
jgi:hypothetical protein